MIALYIFILGIIIIILSLLEFLFPARAFRLWNVYISSRAFFLHGMMLIGGGFPLVMYRGTFSTVILVIGTVVILTGPFIALYPEKVRLMFRSLEEMDGDGIKRVVYFDAAIRLAVGTIFCVSYLL